ncbi:MAG: DsbA family protein [Sphingomicrobium sp.]
MKTLLVPLAMLAALPSIALGQDDIAVSPNIEQAEYFRHSLAPERAAPGGDLTMVYFMDYQCPACRRYTPDVSRVLNRDRRIRVIYRDTPIFGPRSNEAARVAIASQFQGKHEAMHAALMATKLPLDDIALRSAADSSGVDWPQLQRDLSLHGAQIDALIARNLELAEAAGISGTPGFIIGQTLSDGALNEAQLKTAIADARAAQERPRRKPDPATPKQIVEQPAAAAPELAASAATAATAAKNPSATGPAAPMFKKSEPVEKPPAAASPIRFSWLWLILATVGVGALGFAVSRRRRAG